MRHHASTSRSCRLQIRPDAHTDIANLKSSLRLIISGSPHNRSTDMRQGGKKGGLQNKPAQPLCTVCGKFSHDSKACPAKGSPYTNLTPSAFVGSAGHTKLVADKGPRNYIPGAPPVVPNKSKAAETLPVNSTKPSTKSWANKKRGNLIYLPLRLQPLLTPRLISCLSLYPYSHRSGQALEWRWMLSWIRAA